MSEFKETFSAASIFHPFFFCTSRTQDQYKIGFIFSYERQIRFLFSTENPNGCGGLRGPKKDRVFEKEAIEKATRHLDRLPKKAES